MESECQTSDLFGSVIAILFEIRVACDDGQGKMPT